MVVEIARGKHGAVEDIGERIPNDRALDGGHEASLEFVVGLSMDPGSPQARATLTGRAEPGEERALNGEVQICIRKDDEWVPAVEPVKRSCPPSRRPTPATAL